MGSSRISTEMLFSEETMSFTSAPRRGKRSEDPSVFHFHFTVVDVSVDDCPVFGFVKPDVLKNIDFCKSGIS